MIIVLSNPENLFEAPKEKPEYFTITQSEIKKLRVKLAIGIPLTIKVTRVRIKTSRAGYSTCILINGVKYRLIKRDNQYMLIEMEW